MMKATQVPASAYNIEEWIWGLEEEAPKVKVRNGDVDNNGLEQRSIHSYHAG